MEQLGIFTTPQQAASGKDSALRPTDLPTSASSTNDSLRDAAIDNVASWKEVLSGEREKEYFKALMASIEAERAAGKRIYPRNADIFNALSFTPFDRLKVVVIGQDPYHGPGQAHGLCFSVKPGVPLPPSLQNIFKELKQDLGITVPPTGCLEGWARQGVLLLNAVLSVEDGKPGSHAGRGWEQFTDRVIAEINQRKNGVVFILWGSYAQKKCAGIDQARHTVLSSPHPSPLSASRGFFGCRHFSLCNQALQDRGLSPIDWSAL